MAHDLRSTHLPPIKIDRETSHHRLPLNHLQARQDGIVSFQYVVLPMMPIARMLTLCQDRLPCALRYLKSRARVVMQVRAPLLITCVYTYLDRKLAVLYYNPYQAMSFVLCAFLSIGALHPTIHGDQSVYQAVTGVTCSFLDMCSVHGVCRSSPHLQYLLFAPSMRDSALHTVVYPQRPQSHHKDRLFSDEIPLPLYFV